MPFLSHFPERTLYPELGKLNRHQNMNSKEYLQGLVSSTLEQLRYFEGNPSTQMSWIPPDLGSLKEDAECEVREIRDERESKRRKLERGAGVRGEFYR